MHPPTRATPPIHFEIGLVVATKGAIEALLRARELPGRYVTRHRRGDWGEVCPDDAALNNKAVAHEGDPDRQQRVMSSYSTSAGDRIWIITEADRVATTLLLPCEY